MALVRLGQYLIRRLHRPLSLPPSPPTDHHAAVARSLGLSHANTCVRGFSSLPYNAGGVISHKFGGASHVHVVKVLELVAHLDHARPMSTAAPEAASSKVPVRARKVGLKVVMTSPGFVYEPYSIREPISFWKRWFTPSGWRRTKEDIILEMKSAYAVSRLRKKTGHSKKQFYDQALKIYKETYQRHKRKSSREDSARGSSVGVAATKSDSVPETESNPGPVADHGNGLDTAAVRQ